MSALAYEVVDVFTDRPYAGNGLAVVFGADDLTTTQCQAIARAFNLSETVFPMATDRAADYRLRIFTPSAELPFAGHPSVGAAWVQRRRGAVAGATAVQDCLAGLLPLRFLDDGRVEITGGTPTAGPPLDAAPLLAAVGLTQAVGTVRACGTGSDFTYLRVPVGDVARARPAGDLAAALDGTGGHGLYVFSWDDGAVRARMFAPGLGVGEDPATGSAATGLGAWLAAESLVPQGESAFTVSQGAEIGRPSTLFGTVVVEDGRAVACRVSGHVVPVATGEIAVPPR